MTNVPDYVTINELLNSGEFIFFKWENRPHWPVSFVSDNTTEILGYTPESFRSGSIAYSDLIHPEDLSKVIKEVEYFSKSGKERFIHDTYRVIKNDGTIIWVYDSTRIIRNADNDVIYYVGYIMDITPLKKRELSLQERAENLTSEVTQKTDTIQKLNTKLKEDVKVQKTLYEELFNSTKDGIILFRDGLILEYNAAILKMMQCANLDHLQNQLSSFFDDAHPTSMKKMLKKAIKKGLYRFDWEVELKDGNRLWTEVTFTPMMIQDQMTIHSHWRDISRRKELEIINKEKTNQLIQQSRFAQMGEMISMIAHQWRQPLSVISSTIAAMQTKIEIDKIEQSPAANNQKESDYLLKHFDKINNNVQHMSQTINDFRNFFKPDKKASDFYLKDALNRVLSMLEQSFISKGIHLKINFDETLESIYSYENEVIQVLLNLLKNADDALEEKGTEDPKIEINITKEKNTQIVTVVDNAGGVPKYLLDKIFDPYFSTKSKNGTGLGLYMSKTIIEEHCQGRISVSNTEEGACFVIKLPIEIKKP